MGKERRIRKSVRNNPLGLRKLKETPDVELVPASQELEKLKCEEATSNLGLSREELLGKLRSSTPDERASAAVIIANLASAPATLNAVCSGEIIKAAIPLLLDRSIHVRHSIFRFLGAIANDDVDGSDKLLKAGVMSTLEVILKKFVNCDWSKLGKDESTVLEDLLYVLELLCENSETAISIFNKQNYLDVIFPMLDQQLTQSFAISTAAAWCLLAVSECDCEATKRLKGKFAALEGIIKYEHTSMSQVHMKALATALLYTLEAPSTYFPLQLATLKEVLETPSRDLMTLVCEKTVKVSEVERARELEVENLEKMHKDVDFHVTELSELLRAKRVALETLTNLCCSEDDDNEDEWEDMDSDDELSRASVDETMETESTVSNTLSLDHMRTVQMAKLFPLVESHTSDLEPQQIVALGGSKQSNGLLEDVEDVRCRAYFCIDNMVQRLRIEDLGTPEEIYRLFEALMTAMTKSCRDREALFSATSSAMRAVLDCLFRAEKSQRPDVLRCVNPNDLMMVCRATQDFRQPSITINVCRIVTWLALMNASFAPGAVEFLFLVATSTSDLRVCAEAYDCIIDLFSSDDYDDVMHQFQLLEKLKAAAPNFKSMYKVFPKCESKMLAITCNKNLQRFIKYKSGRR